MQLYELNAASAGLKLPQFKDNRFCKIKMRLQYIVILPTVSLGAAGKLSIARDAGFWRGPGSRPGAVGRRQEGAVGRGGMPAGGSGGALKPCSRVAARGCSEFVCGSLNGGAAQRMAIRNGEGKPSPYRSPHGVKRRGRSMRSRVGHSRPPMGNGAVS